MDYKTAQNLIIHQVDLSDPNGNGFLCRLKQGKPPIPGNVTNILLALKILFDGLQGRTELERELVYCLHLLSFDSRQYFEDGRRKGVNWPPLLHEDLNRIARGARNIFADKYSQ
jgi:hypothetical protein